MDNLTLPEVGLDYAGAKVQASPNLALPEMLLPPAQQAVLDAIAMSSKRKMTTDGFLTGATQGKSVQDQIQEQLGTLQPYNQWEQQYGRQAPDTAGPLAAYQQASSNQPQIPDLGRPQVDQTQQFIASLGALFDPKNAGQIMGLPQQNAQVDYEYKVKDAMRRYQMNNQDYEAKVELAKAVYENTVREAAQAGSENKAAYGQYAQDYRNNADNIAADIRNLDAIKGRAENAVIKEEGLTKRLYAKLGADADKQKGKDFAMMAKMTPQGRYEWVKANGGTEDEAIAYGNKTSSELLADARAAKIPYEIKALQSKVILDSTRAKQIVEATRFIGPSFDLKREKLANDIVNIKNLMDARNANIEIRREALAKGAASINNARTTASKILNTATIELGRLMKVTDPTDEQKQRKKELQSAIDANTDLLNQINYASELIPEATEVQKKAASDVMGGLLAPLRVGPQGQAAPFKSGPINSGAGGKGKGGGSSVAPANANVRVTAIRRSGK